MPRALSPRANHNLVLAATLSFCVAAVTGLVNWAIKGYAWLTIGAWVVVALAIVTIIWRARVVLGAKGLNDTVAETLASNSLLMPGATRRGPLIAYGVGLIAVGLGSFLYFLISDAWHLNGYRLIVLLLPAMGAVLVRRGIRTKKPEHVR